MLCVPTLFDVANPHVLKGQPHRADDETRRRQRRQRQTYVGVLRGTGAHEPLTGWLPRIIGALRQS